MLWTRMRGAVAALAVAGVAGCSSVPDDLNPGTWAGGASDWVSGLFDGSNPPPPDVPSAPADQPKLGNDERPKATPPAERQKIADSLVAIGPMRNTPKRSRSATATRRARWWKRMQPRRPKRLSLNPPRNPRRHLRPRPRPSLLRHRNPLLRLPRRSRETKSLKSSAADTAQPTQTASAAPDTDSVVAPSARVKMDEVRDIVKTEGECADGR